MPGRVIHFEIPVDDVERARAFYRNAFDWQMQSVPGMGYTLVTTTPTGDRGPTTPGAINGGMLKRQEPVTAPVVTVEVPDIDASLKKVESLGGATARVKMPVGDMGFAAYFRDPEGNVIGLWEHARK